MSFAMKLLKLMLHKSIFVCLCFDLREQIPSANVATIKLSKYTAEMLHRCW